MKYGKRAINLLFFFFSKNVRLSHAICMYIEYLGIFQFITNPYGGRDYWNKKRLFFFSIENYNYFLKI